MRSSTVTATWPVAASVVGTGENAAMNSRPLTWLRVPLAALAAGVSATPAWAASHATNTVVTPAGTGASTETFVLPNSIVRVTFGPAAGVPATKSPSSSAAYVAQCAEVDDIGTGIFSGFES